MKIIKEFNGKTGVLARIISSKDDDGKEEIFLEYNNCTKKTKVIHVNGRIRPIFYPEADDVKDTYVREVDKVLGRLYKNNELNIKETSVYSF